MVQSLTRTVRTRSPQSPVFSTSTMFSRASGLASGATESSRSRKTWSDSRPWAFSRKRGLEPGTAWQERRARSSRAAGGMGTVAPRPVGVVDVLGSVLPRPAPPGPPRRWSASQSTGAVAMPGARLLTITRAIAGQDDDQPDDRAGRRHLAEDRGGEQGGARHLQQQRERDQHRRRGGEQVVEHRVPHELGRQGHQDQQAPLCDAGSPPAAWPATRQATTRTTAHVP